MLKTINFAHQFISYNKTHSHFHHTHTPKYNLGIAQLVVRQLADPKLRVAGSELGDNKYAGIAQLVEHQLPKLRVAGPNPVSRSNKKISVYELR